MKKIIFIGPLSNECIRNHMKLRSYKLRNKIMKFMHHPLFGYPDIGNWVSEYIKYFEKFTNEYEYHIITVHPGLKQRLCEFEVSNMYYHIINSNSNLFFDYINQRMKIDERLNYSRYRSLIKKISKKINPDLVIVCGAENPQYSWAALDLESYPVYLILQTLLNSEKRIALNIGSQYRRMCEAEIIKSAKYIGVNNDDEYGYVKRNNNVALTFKNLFPSKIPPFFNENKDTDFVFYANGITKFKGIEDALKALSILKRNGRTCRLRIIGSIEMSYYLTIKKIVFENDIADIVEFTGYCQNIEVLYRIVQRSRNILLPSITAPLNSTVKEGMFMGIPIIMYETEASKQINAIEPILITAQMENIEDLSNKMLFALDNVDICNMMAKKAVAYAQLHFSGNAAGGLLQNIIEAICNSNCDKDIDKSLLYH